MAVWYTVRSHKRKTLDDGLPWSNTYEIGAPTNVEAEQAQGGMAAVRVFERALTFETVEFWHQTFSSWRQEEAEETPPDELFPYLGPVQVGQRSAVAGPAPLTDCLFISRIPTTGNKGKLFLRGCLEEQELQLTARKRVLKPAALAGYNTLVNAAWDNFQANLANFGLLLGMVSFPRIGWEVVPTPPGKKPKAKPIYGTTPYERTVSELRMAGMTVVQLNNN